MTREDFVKTYTQNGTSKTAELLKMSIPTVLKYARKFGLIVNKPGRKGIFQ